MSTSFLSLNYINLPSSCDARCQPSVQTCDLPRISSRQHRPVIAEENGLVGVHLGHCKMPGTRPGKHKKNYGKIHHVLAGKITTISTGPFSIAILT